MKVKQIMVLIQAFIIMITTFFSIYIPLMVGNFYFLEYMFNSSINLFSSLFVFCMIAFGFLWIALYVSAKILEYFDKLFDWQTKYDKLKSIRK